MVVVSVISHGHGEILSVLIRHLLNFPEISRVVLTFNIPECVELMESDRLIIIRNLTKKGFGQNHNAAFKLCFESKIDFDYFCPLNPDIKFIDNPFPNLIHGLRHYNAGLVAPLVLNSLSKIEDSVRYFPTPARLFSKLFLGRDGRYDICINQPPFYPEWFAGMFMLFQRVAYERLLGFDEEYYLYYEDADICRRAWAIKIPVLVCPNTTVVHDAQRDSHRKLIYLYWHLKSMIRFFSQLSSQAVLNRIEIINHQS